MRVHVPEQGWFPVEANGLRFACFGEGEGPLLLMLHGFPDTAHTWDELRPRFAREGFRVVTPFMRGYAPTPAPARDDYGAETLARDVLALIEALGAERAAVVGHDWGALAAWAAAARGPERIEKLVTVAIPHPASLRPSPGKLWGVRHFIELQLPGAEERFARNDHAGVRVLYERWSPGAAWEEAEFEAVRNCFAAPGALRAAMGYYRAFSPLVPGWLRRPIQVPTLVVGGETDGVATRADFERSAAWVEAPFAVAMLPGGHFLHREAPDPFFERVSAYLRG